MHRRKLIALEYHHPESFTPHDENQFRNFVIWLEDKVIRQYEVKDRYLLRETSDSEWNKYFAMYLKDLECPINSDDRNKVTGWLLSYAIRLKYGEDFKSFNYQHQERQERKMGACKENEDSNGGTLSTISGDDPHLKAGVASLSKFLAISQHPDHITTLQAVKAVIEDRLSASQVKESGSLQKKNSSKDDEFQKLSDVDLGFHVKDPAVDEAAKILRLLHLHELRDLQTQINKAIVQAQKSTANPKTDHALGQVGR